MSTYRYVTTNLLTGQVLAESLPLNVQSFGANLNGGGTLTMSLDLQMPYSANVPYIQGLECRKSVLWVLQDDYPVWAGVIWDWPDMTREDGGPLQVQAMTLDSVWSHRMITDSLAYNGVDLYTLFLDLLTYGMSKQSGYILDTSPAVQRPPAMLALVAQIGRVANLVLPSGAAALSGVPWSASYLYSDATQISDAWSDLSTAGQFEYSFNAGLDSSANLAYNVQLGYSQLGRPLGQSGYSLTYPGNCLDYGYQRTGSQSANVVWASASPNGSSTPWYSAFPHGWDLGDLANGYPLMETSVSWNNSILSSQEQIDAFADGQVEIYTQAMDNPIINLPPVMNIEGAGAVPTLQNIVLGDSTWFSATSPLHPPVQPGNQPGLQEQVRITGWTCYPPGPAQAEYVQVSTSSVAVT